MIFVKPGHMKTSRNDLVLVRTANILAMCLFRCLGVKFAAFGISVDTHCEFDLLAKFKLSYWT